MSNLAKFTCPFCIHEYDKKDVLHVCPDCGMATTPKFMEKEPIKCRHIDQDSKRPCGGLATLRVCPHCQYNTDPSQGPLGLIQGAGSIPRTALDTPNLPFSIVGISNSGKTNYITVMLNELSRSSGLKIALGHQTSQTLARQSANYQRVYEQHIPAELTQAGESTPLIWYIKNLEKMRGSNVPTYTFTIFDGAGEDHEQNIDPTSNVCRYIRASKAIILTLDPLVLSSIRRGGVVDREVMANSLGGHTGETKVAENVINSVAEDIKQARGLKTHMLLDIPVAVVLTKFDTILNHRAFGPQSLIRKRSLSVRNGKVVMSEIAQVDAEIRNWLYEIGEGGFIAALQSHFKEFSFFGVSSFGQPPIDAFTIHEITPHRVLDPILWLFHREGFID